jgi:hypothetical protein
VDNASASNRTATGPVLTQLPKRQLEICFYIEGKDAAEKRIALVFDEVESFKCTYLHSLELEMIENAYGKLVRLNNNPWLVRVLQQYNKYYEDARRTPKELRHLMICFDDGPCFEFICVGFRYV